MSRVMDGYLCAALAIEVFLVVRVGMVYGRTCPRLGVQHEMAFTAANSFRLQSTLAKNLPFCVLMRMARSLVLCQRSLQLKCHSYLIYQPTLTSGSCCCRSSA